MRDLEKALADIHAIKAQAPASRITWVLQPGPATLVRDEEGDFNFNDLLGAEAPVVPAASAGDEDAAGQPAAVFPAFGGDLSFLRVGIVL